ncbi:glycosyl hydrolase, partial [Streptomyces sp. NPDC048845]
MHRKRLRFRKHLALATSSLLAGAMLAIAPQAGAHPGHDDAPAAEDFQQVTLAKGAEETGEPMSLAVLPDRSVLHTSRDGTLRITDAGGT